MALPARKFEAEMFMEERVTRLEDRAERIQTDVTGLKADVIRIDGKIDVVVERIAETERTIRNDFKAELDEQRKEAKADLAAARAESQTAATAARADFKEEMTKARADLKEDLTKLDRNFRALATTLHNDFKSLLRAGAAGCAFILVAFAAGYLNLSSRDDQLFEKLSRLEVVVERIAAVHGIEPPEEDDVQPERDPEATEP